MKKTGIIVCAALAAALLLSACSGDKMNYSISADQVASTTVSPAKTPDLAKLSTKQAGSRYAFTTDEMSELTVYVAQDGAYADEIAVVKMPSADKGGDVEKILKQRVDAISENFKGYQPKECDKISKAVILTKGNFALLAVSDSTANIKDGFNKALDASAAKG